MAFSESTNITYGGGGQADQQSQFEDQSAASSPLNKQSSIFSLTLDEIQVKSGKSFGSMNMDEFLTNLWNNVDGGEDQVNQPTITETKPTLTRQNSFSIPTQLCKKTVEEVWSEIQKDPPQTPNLNHIANLKPPQRQPTFGEITLEDFLIKAGVVQEQPPAAAAAPPPKPSPPPLAAAPAPMQSSNDACLDATTYGMGITCPMMAVGYSTQPSMGMGMGTNNNLLLNGYAAAAYPMYTPTRIVGELANNNNQNDKSQCMFGPKGSRKRLIDDLHEVVVERRQRRMIKNRESAARSRARKQV